MSEFRLQKMIKLGNIWWKKFASLEICKIPGNSRGLVLQQQQKYNTIKPHSHSGMVDVRLFDLGVQLAKC